eukprot:1905504-Rhodomonas_salina.1
MDRWNSPDLVTPCHKHQCHICAACEVHANYDVIYMDCAMPRLRCVDGASSTSNSPLSSYTRAWDTGP